MDTNNIQGQGAAQDQPATLDFSARFAQFDSYPWVRDRSFLQGLMATLGPSFRNTNEGFMRQKAMSTTLQARIWWYKSQFHTDIDRVAYEAYSAKHADTCPDSAILAKLEDIQQRMGIISASASTSTSTENIPAWQLNAPKVDLSVKAEDGGTHANANGGVPYPDNFQALVEAVTQGKPIPGIREIPNIVVRPPGISPFGKMKAPPKPWEKHRSPEELAQMSSVFTNIVDKEFPPLPADNANDNKNTNTDNNKDNNST